MAEFFGLFNPQPAAQADRRSADRLRTLPGRDFDVTYANVGAGDVDCSA